jgi:hypothetical protein
MAAVALLAVSSAALLPLWLRTRARLRTSQAAARDRIEAAERLAGTQEERLGSLEAQLKEQVAGRLPKPLLPLATDTLIDLGGMDASLRSVLFTRVGPKDCPEYEYRLTCRNEKGEPAQPRFQILVFNRAGIQTGAADVTRSADWTRLDAGGLAPGESCSFSGHLEFQFEDSPEYFLVVPVPLGGKPPRLAP